MAGEDGVPHLRRTLQENKIAEIRSTLSPRITDLIEPSRRSVEIATSPIRKVFGPKTR